MISLGGGVSMWSVGVMWGQCVVSWCDEGSVCWCGRGQCVLSWWWGTVCAKLVLWDQCVISFCDGSV